MMRKRLGSPVLWGLVQAFVAAALLLLARPGVRARARADVGRLRRRRRVLRPHAAVLRRGRVAAPGARRRDRHHPLRVQRAVELRRRLGDPARLPDPDRADGVRRRPTTSACSGASSGAGGSSSLGAAAIIAAVAWINFRGLDPRRFERFFLFALADLAVQVVLLILGLLVLFEPEVLTAPASIARRRRLRGPRVLVHARGRRLHGAGRVVGVRRAGGGRPARPAQAAVGAARCPCSSATSAWRSSPRARSAARTARGRRRRPR